MAKYFTEFAIELHPYLIKYVVSEAKTNEISIDARNEIGAWILNHVKHPDQGFRPRRIPRERKLVIKVPSHYFKNRSRGKYLSNDHKKALANSIESMFWKDLCEFAYSRKLQYGEKELVSIRKFREFHSISEDDFKEESMYKRFRRWKETRQKPVNIDVD